MFALKNVNVKLNKATMNLKNVKFSVFGNNDIITVQNIEVSKQKQRYFKSFSPNFLYCFGLLSCKVSIQYISMVEEIPG